VLKYTQGTSKDVPNNPHTFENQPTKLKKSADFLPSSPALASFRIADRLAGDTKQPGLPRKAAGGHSKRAKKVDSQAQALAAPGSRYLGNKSSPSGHPVERLKSNQQQAREVAAVLKQRAYSFDDDFFRIGRKLENCAVYGAFRLLPSGAANKIGQAMCKHRGCPTCQRVLSIKRRDAATAFFKDNQEQLSGYYFYHLVLTLRHNAEEEVRTHFYLPDLIRYFKELRGVTGKVTAWRKWWDKRVAGGFCSIETTPSKDKTAHIHMHILLIGKMPLWASGGKTKDGKPKARTSKFLEQVKLKWLELTGADRIEEASTQVHLEPVYTWKVDEQGEPLLDAKGEKIKDFAHKAKFGGASADEHLLAAVSECAKYTMKTDAASLEMFSDDMLRDLLTQRHRYYGRFGILHAKHPDSSKFKNLNRLNADFKDLSEVDAKRAKSLWDPKEQATVRMEDTKAIVSPFRNMSAHQAGGSVHKDEDGKARGHENYYQVIDPDKVIVCGNEQELAKNLSATIYKWPDKADQLEAPGQEQEGEAPPPAPLPAKSYGWNNFRYHDDSDWLAARAADDAGGVSIKPTR
jgi:hypothetical protein